MCVHGFVPLSCHGKGPFWLLSYPRLQVVMRSNVSMFEGVERRAFTRVGPEKVCSNEE